MKLLICAVVIFAAVFSACSQEAVRFRLDEGSLDIHINEQKIAEFVFADESIPRSYFAHVTTQSGIQVTRNYPPKSGVDKDDHATYHPGIWMTFGDISGQDYWRNKAVTKHIAFSQQPRAVDGKGQFAVTEHHLKKDSDEVICIAEHQFMFDPIESGTLIVWDSKFYTGSGSFVFGDQEEMGLGIRVATPIIAENGGEILNKEGLKNGEGVWGKQSDWAVYHGTIEEKKVGILLMPSPKNFRKSWFHARDYGLLVANPFGRNAFTKAAKSRIEVQEGETFVTQFGIFIFEGAVDYQEIYQAYIEGYMQ